MLQQARTSIVACWFSMNFKNIKLSERNQTQGCIPYDSFHIYKSRDKKQSGGGGPWVQILNESGSFCGVMKVF